MLAAATTFLLSVSACSAFPEASSNKGLPLEGQARQEYVAKRIRGYFHPAAGEVPVPPLCRSLRHYPPAFYGERGKAGDPFLGRSIRRPGGAAASRGQLYPSSHRSLPDLGRDAA